jgi:dsDNA-specific endonuclease/ATPase MutS2
MSGEMDTLSPREKKIYLEEGTKILNRNITGKNMGMRTIVMKTCLSAVSTRILE